MTKVFVYFNLHRRLFSMKAMDGPTKGKVIAHESSVLLRSPIFTVSQAGRRRVLREKRKNVHAGIVGEWIRNGEEWDAGRGMAYASVRYNPYENSSFVRKDGTEIRSAEWAMMAVKDGRPMVGAYE